MAMSESMRDEIQTRAQETLPALTIEATLYIAFALVGLLLRLLALDGAPLSSDEARQALASWNFARGMFDPFTGSPLLFTGNASVFALFGASDATARMIPALVGGALILLPALLRNELGRAGALIASALLALSPSLVFFSRQTDGAILASTFALAALVFAWRYLNQDTARELYLAAICAALALVSAPDVWTIIAAMLLFGIASRFGLIASVRVDNRQSAIGNRKSTILFALVFLGVSTAFLFRRDGIGAAFDMFGVWLAGLTPGGSPFDPFRTLVVYEPIALFFGVAATIDLIFAFTQKERAQIPPLALAWWAFFALVLYSISGDKNPTHLVVIVVPLTLVAAAYIGAWWTRLVEAIQASPDARDLLVSQEAPVLFLASAVAGFLYLLIAEFTTRGNLIAADTFVQALGQTGASVGGVMVWLLILAGIISVGAVTMATVGWARAKNVGMFFVLMLLTLWTIRQMAMANFPSNGALNPQDWLVTRAASSNVRDLVRDLEDVSRWRANDTHALDFAVDASLGPLVMWNLREFRYASFAPISAPTSDAQAFVLPADAPAPGAEWISQKYQIEVSRLPNQNFARWLIFRDAVGAQVTEAVLWIPSPK